MFILCVIIGIIDIVAGAILAANNPFLGIAIILSGIIFIYFARGSHVAFINASNLEKHTQEYKNQIDELELKLVAIQKCAKIPESEINAVVDEYVLKKNKSFTLETMGRGFPLVFVNKNECKKFVIEKGTYAEFYSLDKNKPNTVTVKVKINDKDVLVECPRKDVENSYVYLERIKKDNV